MRFGREFDFVNGLLVPRPGLVGHCAGGRQSQGPSNYSLYVWGNNTSGYGDGAPITTYYSPTSISSPEQITLMRAGCQMGAKFMADGALYVTGLNTNGQLGLGDTTARNTWVQVKSPSMSFKLGYFNIGLSYVLDSSGKLYHAGDKLYRDGNGTTTSGNNLNFTQIGSDADWVDVKSNGLGAFALKSDGTLWSWGVNSGAWLANGTASTSETTPSQKAAGVAKFAVGQDSSFYIDGSGGLYVAGNSTECGAGTQKNSFYHLGSGYADIFTTIANGINSTAFAIKTNGDVYVWGSNYNGMAGLGTTSPSFFSTPQLFASADTWVKFTGGQFSAGVGASFGMKSDGTIWGWGQNSYNGLGSSSGNTLTPTRIGTSNWLDIFSGGYVSYAIRLY